MATYFNQWEEYIDFLKPTFGNRKNWYRYCWIIDRLRLRIICGVV